MPMLSNKVKSRYLLKEKLGTGGMGVVYRAYDSVINADVALKTLNDIPDPVALRLFREECDKLAKIVHPNVVEIRDVGEIEEGGARKPYLVMPFLRGRTLDTIILDSPGGLPLERAIEILIQACRGLQATHDAGLIHRDIKPSNIFVLEDDSVKLIDFGVAHYAENLLTLTRKGTLMYMAPEQVTMRGISPLSDIFSLGVVAYETLTGRRPFEGKTEKELVAAILHRNPPPASRSNPRLNAAFDQTLQKALAKLQEARFQSAREFAETLRKAALNQPIALFDPQRIEERLEQAQHAIARGDLDLAGDILKQLELQGYLDDRIAAAKQEYERMRDQRSIASLLASARTRIDAFEYGLAAEKIDEVLRIDPQNAQAEVLREEIERQRAEYSVQQTLEQARRAFAEQDFERAKELVSEALAIRPNETAATQLRSEIQRREQEYHRLIDEKRRLERQAQQAFHNSDPERALELIERALALDAQAPESAQASAELRKLYDRIQQAADVASSALAQARSLFQAGDFRAALARCDEMLGRFPGHALFRALKLDVENAERQRTAQVINEVESEVAAERDLAGQVEILKAAAERYPDIPHFGLRYKTVFEKHQFVESLVEKARSAERDGRLSDALAEWRILRSIYPEYPRLEEEIARLEQQKTVEADRELRESLLHQIRQAVNASEFEGALHILNTAARGFSDDKEFAELRILAESGVEWDRRTGRYLEQAERLTKARQYDEALDLLDKARKLDVRVNEINAARQRVLVEKGRALLDKDSRKAEQVLQEALELAPRNQTTHKLLQKARERNRKERVSAATGRIRRLQTMNDYDGALEAAEEALAQHPDNTELMETVGRLRRHRESRLSEAGAVAPVSSSPAPEPPAEVVPEPPRGFLQSAWHKAAGFTRKPDAPRPSGGRARSRLQTVVLTDPSAAAASDGGVVLSERTPTRDGRPAASAPRHTTAARLAPAARRVKLPVLIFLIAMVVTAVILAVVARQRSRSGRVLHGSVVASNAASVPLQVTPAQAEVRVDGQTASLSGGALHLSPGRHLVEARLPGFKTFSQQLAVTAGENALLAITLAPLAPSIRVETDFPSGAVLLDDKPAGSIDGGQFSLEAPEGSHVLGVADADGTRYFFPYTLDANHVWSAGPPRSAGYGTPVLASFASSGMHILCGRAGMMFQLDDAAPAPCTRTPTDLPAPNTGDHKITILDGTRSIGTRTINFQGAPVLDAFVITGMQVGGLVLTANQDEFQVSVNGAHSSRPAEGGRWRRLLKPADYQIAVSKPGFTADPATFTVSVKANADTQQQIKFTPVPVVGNLSLHSQPGAEVSINGQSAGTVPESGELEIPNIPVGTVELKLHRKGFADAQRSITLAAGENSQNVPLQPLKAHLAWTVDPATAEVSYTDANATRHPLTGSSIDLPAGTYRFDATAPGRTPDSATITVEPGETRNFVLHLNAPKKAAVPDVWPGWETQDGWMVRSESGPIMRTLPESTTRVSWQAKWQHQKTLVHWFGGPLIVVFRSADGKRSLTLRIGEHNVSWNAVNGDDRKDGKFALNLGKAPVSIVAALQPSGVVLTLNGHRLDAIGPDFTTVKTQFGFQVENDQIVQIRDLHIAKAGE